MEIIDNICVFRIEYIYDERVCRYKKKYGLLNFRQRILS